VSFTKSVARRCNRVLQERLGFCIESQLVVHPSDCGLQSGLQFRLISKARRDISSLPCPESHEQ